MGRSSGFSLGGSYAPYRQLQQQSGGMSSGSMNASDLQHLHASIADSFPSSHGLSSSYHSQVKQLHLVNVHTCSAVLLLGLLGWGRRWFWHRTTWMLYHIFFDQESLWGWPCLDLSMMAAELEQCCCMWVDDKWLVKWIRSSLSVDLWARVAWGPLWWTSIM